MNPTFVKIVVDNVQKTLVFKIKPQELKIVQKIVLITRGDIP